LPAPKLTVPIEPVREAVRRAVTASDFRTVAKQIGMSHGGLFRFLSGTAPRAGTVRKLLRWYTARAAVGDWEPDELSTRAAVTVLLEGLSEAERDAGAAEVLRTVRRVYEERRAPVPRWLTEME
jgi:hypothetical protein